ncbi:hypothetical protein [Actinobacillus equuli]
MQSCSWGKFQVMGELLLTWWILNTNRT